jgi:uncharacterized protein involved in exopolysaccharide biosynthesis
MTEELQFVGSHQPRTPTMRDLAAIFFRHKRLLGISFFLVFGVGFAYTLLTITYSSQMKVVVRRGRIDPAITAMPSSAPLVQRDEVSDQDLNSEMELIRDEDALREVVEKEGLAERRSWSSALHWDDREQRISRAVQRLRNRLDVQPVRKSQLITVSYRSSDPRLAAAILKRVGGTYLRRHSEIQRPTGQQRFFEAQVEESRRALKAAQSDLIRFNRLHETSSAAIERDLTLQKLCESRSVQLGLQASIAENKQRANALDAKLRDLPQHRVVQVTDADNPQLQEKLKSKLLELELRRTELLTKFQPSYRLVQEVEQQIAQAKSAIATEELKPLQDKVTEQDPDYAWANSERVKTGVEIEALEKKQAVATMQVAAYQSRAQNLAEQAVEQEDLERKLKAAEETFLLYARKREEARISDALDQTGILNVAIAQQPTVPAFPVRPLWASLGLVFMAACVLSSGAALVAEYVDSSFRTPGEVTRSLGVPVLAALPAGRPLRTSRRSA